LCASRPSIQSDQHPDPGRAARSSSHFSSILLSPIRSARLYTIANRGGNWDLQNSSGKIEAPDFSSAYMWVAARRPGGCSEDSRPSLVTVRWVHSCPRWQASPWPRRLCSRIHGPSHTKAPENSAACRNVRRPMRDPWSNLPTTVDAKAPPDGTFAPPGYYLLFLVDHDRSPSTGVWIWVTP